MALKQISMHSMGTFVQRLLAHRFMLHLFILALVTIVLLLTVWWHFSSAVSHVTVTPSSVTKPTAATAELPPVATPVTPETAATQVQVSTEQTTPATTTTQLEVNGQPVAVPKNGTAQQTVQSPDGNTSVHLSVDSNSSSSKNTSSSTHIQMNSTSHSQVVNNETQ